MGSPVGQTKDMSKRRNKRPQSPKNARHLTNADKSHMRTGPVIRGARYDRTDERQMRLNGGF